MLSATTSVMTLSGLSGSMFPVISGNTQMSFRGRCNSLEMGPKRLSQNDGAGIRRRIWHSTIPEEDKENSLERLLVKKRSKVMNIRKSLRSIYPILEKSDVGQANLRCTTASDTIRLPTREPPNSLQKSSCSDEAGLHSHEE